MDGIKIEANANRYSYVWAKPIIDIDIVMESYHHFPEITDKLASIGYHHEENLGIPGREAFKYNDKLYLMRHHLYICSLDSPELRRHITFRDHLRTHPDDVKAYSEVKCRGAEIYPYDIDGYIAYKSTIINEIYQKCGLCDD